MITQITEDYTDIPFKSVNIHQWITFTLVNQKKKSMKSLSVNWFIEGSLDFEYKKYQLLAYLQQINQHFNKTKLYPDLNDLIFHYNNIFAFR